MIFEVWAERQKKLEGHIQAQLSKWSQGTAKAAECTFIELPGLTGENDE